MLSGLSRLLSGLMASRVKPRYNPPPLTPYEIEIMRRQRQHAYSQSRKSQIQLEAEKGLIIEGQVNETSN